MAIKEHIRSEIDRIGIEIRVRGHTTTTIGRLEIAGFTELATSLGEVVLLNDQFSGELQEERNGMLMCKDKATKAAGSALVRPVLDVLFHDQPEVIGNWDMYTINHYREGDFFKPHQDYLEDGTVMILTAAGARRLDVYEREEEDDVFRTIEASYELTPGSILLLNAGMNIGHAATCTEGPSISVVGDVTGAMPGSNPAI